MSSLAAKATIYNIRPHMVTSPVRDDGASAPVLLNSNESALGPSPAAREAAQSALATVERYPDEAPQRLAAALAQRFALDPARIVVGSGSDELLARAARAYVDHDTELVHSARGYLKFPNYAHANGGVPVAAPDESFRASVTGILSCVSARTRVVMLANPDNPTGTYLAGDEVRELRRGLPEHVLLVLDSAYAEYVDDPGYEVASRLVEELDNVVMTRTFSKIFGLAGLRLGWLYGAPAVVDVLKRIGTTFPISSPALAAGLAALADREHTDRVRAHNTRWREWLAGELTTLGFVVYPSGANFVLARVDSPNLTAADVDSLLSRHGIAIRRFNSPAYVRHFRVTVGLEGEMRRLVEVLRHCGVS
jgi:histidinol-phosphate aminotransferase